MLDKIHSLINEIKADLLRSRQRVVIASHISPDISSQDISNFVSSLNFSRLLIVSSTLENAILPNKTSVNLGEEYDCVIFDARDVFYPDALGVVSGVLCGGGPLIIFLPEKKHWLETSSNYFSHFKSLLTNKSGVYYLEDNKEAADNWRLDSISSLVDESVDAPYKSVEQKNTIAELTRLITAGEDACAVLVSGRGRGKTSSLGLMVAELIEHDSYKVLITSPRKSISEPFFRHLINHCSEGVENKSGYVYENSTVKFIAPDSLIENNPEADLLIVDEAAAIPLHMLEMIVNNYRKVVFSTTTHGYEGTGRGFVMKFYRLLDKNRPDWLKLELHQPVRWGRGDCLERWVEDLLFLNNRLAENINFPLSPADCKVEIIDRSRWIGDKDKLSSLFSLLVFAHYRTSPADFQYLLDDENVRIYVLSYNENSLGVLVINQEGEFDAALSTSIYRGERRPKGNLLAQTLSFHAGYESAAQLKYARVMRVAIHPDAQNRGLGSYLLHRVIEHERENNIDILGSSFSSTVELLKFWERAGLSVLRLGFSCDHVTASHSAVMGIGLTDRGVDIVNELGYRFQRNLCMWEQGPLRSIANNIKDYLHRNTHHYDQAFSDVDRKDVDSFVHYSRNYEACMPAINRLIVACENKSGLSLNNDKNIIKISQSAAGDWKKVVELMGVRGKSEAIASLRLALRELLDFYDDEYKS